MRFVRHDGAPPWIAWLVVAMGGALLVVLEARESNTEERLALALVAAVLLTTGVAVLLRGASQTIQLEAGSGQIVIVDRMRVGSRRTVVELSEVLEVAVEDHTDEDPDAWPFRQTTHRVVLRMRSGAALPLTDFGLEAARAARVRDEVAALLPGHEPREPVRPPGRSMTR